MSAGTSENLKSARRAQEYAGRNLKKDAGYMVFKTISTSLRPRVMLKKNCCLSGGKSSEKVSIGDKMGIAECRGRGKFNR